MWLKCLSVRTQADGAASVKLLCELAAEQGKLVDMHCDESDDPLSRHVETLAYETQRLGLHGRVTGSHLTSMHSMDNYYVSKLLPLMAEAQLSVVANPLINITLQGRHDSYPKRRGMTRVPEIMAAGMTVAFGHDCVMDPWYSMGHGDMLEVASMGLHVAQMTGQAAMQQCFDAVTQNPARILQLQGYGWEPCASKPPGCGSTAVASCWRKRPRARRRCICLGDRRKRPSYKENRLLARVNTSFSAIKNIVNGSPHCPQNPARPQALGANRQALVCRVNTTGTA
jgi:hypothetical protein